MNKETFSSTDLLVETWYKAQVVSWKSWGLVSSKAPIILKCINSYVRSVCPSSGPQFFITAFVPCVTVSLSESLGNLSQGRQESCKLRLQKNQVRRNVTACLKGGIFGMFFCRSQSFWKTKCRTLMVALCCLYQALFLGVQKFQDSSGECLQSVRSTRNRAQTVIHLVWIVEPPGSAIYRTGFGTNEVLSCVWCSPFQ